LSDENITLEVCFDRRRARGGALGGGAGLCIGLRHAVGSAAAASGRLHHRPRRARCRRHRHLAFVGLGIAIMFAAVSFFLDFFGFAGGAVL
jgi:hypothetical protein